MHHQTVVFIGAEQAGCATAYNFCKIMSGHKSQCTDGQPCLSILVEIFAFCKWIGGQVTMRCGLQLLLPLPIAHTANNKGLGRLANYSFA